MKSIEKVVELHQKSMKPGKPMLDWCDEAVMVSSTYLVFAKYISIRQQYIDTLFLRKVLFCSMKLN